jgi:phosphatidylinositol alpha-mannosyltransferase
MPLRIALVSPYDYSSAGGVQEHIRSLDRQLRAMGHETWILAPASDGPNDEDDNVIHVKGTVAPVHFSGSVARITISPAAYRRVKEIVRDNAFDVIHVHEPLTPILPLAVLRHSRSVNVGTFHAYRESHAGYQLGRPVLEPFFNRLHGRIAVSPAARDMVARYFPAEYVVIPNGIDYDRFAGEDVQPLAEYRDGRPTILFVGRLDDRKGFAHLLAAFVRVAAELPDARLLVVGGFDTGDKSEFVRAARRAKLHGVRFIGFVPSADIPRYYRSADLFCAPSTGFESFGIVLLEAMAAGVPIVASDILGYRSVLTHGREGLLVPPGDENALAAALLWLLKNPEARKPMAEAGRATALGYRWDCVAAQVFSMYTTLLERRRSTKAEEMEERSIRDLVSRVSSWFDPR